MPAAPSRSAPSGLQLSPLGKGTGYEHLCGIDRDATPPYQGRASPKPERLNGTREQSCRRHSTTSTRPNGEGLGKPQEGSPVPP